MKTETDKNFTIRYSFEAEPYSVDFEVFEITGHVEGSSGEFDVPIYERKGATSSNDDTDTIDEAQTLIHGKVKWDGCSHYYFGDEEGYIHLCGKLNIQQIAEVLQRVYFKCGEIMGEKVLDDEFIIK
jgi:hypothetical protein